MARWRVINSDITMIFDCLSAFENKDYNKAVRLLPLLVKKAEEAIQLHQKWSLGTKLSFYTITISPIDPWYDGYPAAGILHLSSRNGWFDITRKLIEQYHLDPRVGDKEGNTSLHYAAAGNQLEVMKYLISRIQLIGELHSVRNKYGATPPHIAAANGSLNVIKHLIEHHHWNTKDTDKTGKTVLHYAVRHIDTVKYLITECKCDPMVINKDGKTVLHCAVGNIDTVKYLITECNCDPMVTDKDGKTVLHYAVEQKHLNVAEYLVLTGKCDPILAANKYGNTVLSFAIDNESFDIVKYLICHPMAPEWHIPHQAVKQNFDYVKYLITECNCDPMVTDKDGKTVLHCAVGNIDTVKYLITECNCDPMVTDKDGKTVLHYAVEEKHLNVAEYLALTGKCDPILAANKYGNIVLLSTATNGSLDITKYLIHNHKCDPMVTDKDGKTVLHCAVGNIDTVKYLITECNCDPMVTDKDGKTVLHYAVEQNQLAVVENLVLTGKCDPILAANKYGNIVLFFAATNGSFHIARHLIHNHECDPMATDKHGKTVLHYAVQNNHLAVVEYLVLTGKCDPILAANNYGNTVLIFAATKGLLDTVKYFIHNCKCDPMVTDKYGKTVLHYAVEQNRLDIVEYLVSTGKCDPILAANKYGNTVLIFAATNGSLDIVKYLIQKHKCNIMVTRPLFSDIVYFAFELEQNHLDVFEYLVSTNPVDTYGNTLLHLSAAKTYYVDFSQRLIIKYKYDPEATNQLSQRVLHCAAKNNKLVKYLITECNCDPMVTDKDGKTVLHYAAKRIDVVKYLITECNCDPMVTDKYGKTVLHYAVKHINTVKYLITECNCDPMVTDKYGKTVLHYAVKHINTVKYLITECNCDPKVTDKDGKKVLHYAAEKNRLDVVEYLLSTGKCDPVAKDNEGRTPLQLTTDAYSWRNIPQTIQSLFKKFGQVKTSHPVDSYVNVLLLGNPGAGKSTLSKVINDTATGSITFGFYSNVKEVEPFTAGIIPYKLQHKILGNIILHDFAGHSEYYSSHSAVIENLLQGSAGVFLIVVNIKEKGAVKQLQQWLTVVRNEEQKALDQCHVIVVVSHVDEISNPVERKRKEEMQEIIGREMSVFLDCRKLGGSGVDSLFNKLSSACESIRSTSGRNLSLYCHMMYGLLEERRENILTLSDVMTAAQYNDSYVLPDEREEVLDVLYSLDSIGLIKVPKSEDKVWVVVNKGILLSEVNGILFAPETFKEHVNIASNTGIVSVSGLTRLFPHYDPDMLTCFLQNMELCQEMNPSFLRMTNLHQLTVGKTERRGEKLLFFPCLLHSDRPDEMTSQVYQFGWCLQCTGEHHFFPPRYFHILSLHLAYKLALPQHIILSCRCTFWKNGLYWFNGYGVGVLVEIVDESQSVLVLMSCEEGYNIVELRREVIGEVMSIYKESCPSLEVKELVIDPEELDYPVNTPRERTVYSVKEILSAINEGRPFTVSDTGIKEREVKSILPDESLEDISKLSLLGGRDIKVRINA